LVRRNGPTTKIKKRAVLSSIFDSTALILCNQLLVVVPAAKFVVASIIVDAVETTATTIAVHGKFHIFNHVDTS